VEKITSKWEIGRRILEDHNNFDRQHIYGKNIASTVAQSLGVSTRNINRCITFARKTPNLKLFWQTAPEGKALTWSWVIRNYLPDKKGEENENNKSEGGANRNKEQLKDNTKGIVSFSSPDEYKAYVQSQPCCVCGKRPAVFAHFPVTKARKDEHWGIPLCEWCHLDQHQDPLDFMWINKRKWAEFLFGLLFHAE